MYVDIAIDWLRRRAIFRLSYRQCSFGGVGYLVDLGPAIVEGRSTLGLLGRSL